MRALVNHLAYSKYILTWIFFLYRRLYGPSLWKKNLFTGSFIRRKKWPKGKTKLHSKPTKEQVKKLYFVLTIWYPVALGTKMEVEKLRKKNRKKNHLKVSEKGLTLLSFIHPVVNEITKDVIICWCWQWAKLHLRPVVRSLSDCWQGKQICFCLLYKDFKIFNVLVLIYTML